MGAQLRARGPAAGPGERSRHRPDLRRRSCARGPLLRVRAGRRREPGRPSAPRSAVCVGGGRRRRAAVPGIGSRPRPERRAPRRQAGQHPALHRRAGEGGRLRGRPAGRGQHRRRLGHRGRDARATWRPSRLAAEASLRPPTSTASASCSTRCSPAGRRSPSDWRWSWRCAISTIRPRRCPPASRRRCRRSSRRRWPSGPPTATATAWKWPWHWPSHAWRRPSGRAPGWSAVPAHASARTRPSLLPRRFRRVPPGRGDQGRQGGAPPRRAAPPALVRPASSRPRVRPPSVRRHASGRRRRPGRRPGSPVGATSTQRGGAAPPGRSGSRSSCWRR